MARRAFLYHFITGYYPTYAPSDSFAPIGDGLAKKAGTPLQEQEQDPSHAWARRDPSLNTVEN